MSGREIMRNEEGLNCTLILQEIYRQKLGPKTAYNQIGYRYGALEVREISHKVQFHFNYLSPFVEKE